MLKVTQLVSGIAPSAFLRALPVTGRLSQGVRGEASPAGGNLSSSPWKRCLGVMVFSEVTKLMFQVWKPDFPLQPGSWLLALNGENPASSEMAASSRSESQS